MNKLYGIRLIIFSLFILIFFSCKRFVEIAPPKTQLVSASLFTNDISATAAISGIYSQMMESLGGFANGNITLFTGLSSDELVNYSTDNDQIQFYQNSLTSSTGSTSLLWTQAYQFLNYVNSLLEGLSNTQGVSVPLKQQLIGEAKFIRAFCHFYLVNLFGNIPLVTSSDYRINSIASRTPKSQIYQQIVKDLTDAQNLMVSDYSFSNGERVRPNKWAATALLARVYLYEEDWVDAEALATAVINNISNYSLVSNLDSVFLANNVEAIWQLKPVVPGINTFEASMFILTTTPPDSRALSQNLLNAFEKGDNRKKAWIDSTTDAVNSYYYPFKYKVYVNPTVSEYYMVLRLAEQFLIRAEARSHQNKLSDAISDLNTIRTRAGLPDLSSSLSQAQVFSAVAQERRVELFAEWGHRWLDLKRTNTADAVMSTVTPQKGGTWSTDWQLYPIPQSEILNDPNLIQNTGY